MVLMSKALKMFCKMGLLMKRRGDKIRRGGEEGGISSRGTRNSRRGVIL